MIKRSSGFFKIAFFIFCLFIALFLIFFSLTDIRNYVTTETCILIFCLSITIIPLIVELIVYSLGVLTKGIRVSSKEDIFEFKSMKNSNVPYASLNDNGTEKMMFFCDKGKIAILSAQNTNIVWNSSEDKIIIKSKFGECFSVFKSIYGVKYENVECTVYTTLSGTADNNGAPSQNNDNAYKDADVSTPPPTNQQTANAVQAPIPHSTDTPVQSPNAFSQPAPQETQQNPLQGQQTVNLQEEQAVYGGYSVSADVPNFNFNSNYAPILETVEEFDYSLTDADTLFEETINL